MKRTMTLNQFKDYIELHRPSKIIFDTANQSWLYSPLRFHLSFSDIGIHYAPDQIFLVGDMGNICLQCIKKVRVDDTDNIYTKVTVTCGTNQKDVENAFRLLLYN